LNVGSLRPLRSLNNLELDRISFLQSAITIAGDCRIVDENVGTVVAPYEPVPFGIIEPLYRSSHRDSPPVVATEIKKTNGPRLEAPTNPAVGNLNVAESSRKGQAVKGTKDAVGKASTSFFAVLNGLDNRRGN
jgi:hypothetical protein